MFLAASFLSLAAMLPVSAPELPQPTAIEVERLLSVLGTSECRFNRNGTWYGGQEAQGHLRMKYDYLVRKKLIHGTEDFIAGAGEKSSLSGQPYQVECPGQPAVPSAEWLRNRLSEIRRNGA